MKEKIQYIVIDGPQVILAIIAQTLLTVWIIAHACKGTLNVLGLIIAVMAWGILFTLTRMSIRDFKQSVNQHSSQD